MTGTSRGAPARVAVALARGETLAREPWTPHPELVGVKNTSGRFSRSVAVGDPQASFETYLRILDRHGLLGEDGRLAEDVSLLSIGDHFDYGGDLDTVREDGVRLLRWLADHPPEQAPLLAGNHDLCRVIEFWDETDERFARARARAQEILELGNDGSRGRFREEFPEIPTPEVALRDSRSFTEAQRSLVQSLLLGGRLGLARVARLRDGGHVLATHAAVTVRDLTLLGLGGERRAVRIAAALEQRLGEAVERVRPAWSRGEMAPLDLGPLYVAGGRGREGGGLLYHRPANPQVNHGDRSWEGETDAPRRFDPRNLPLGLLQACGHAGHHKCVADLGEWVAPEARSIDRGGLRTLRTDGTHVVYEMGIQPVPPSHAGLYMIDGEMNRVPVEDYPTLDVAEWLPPAIDT